MTYQNWINFEDLDTYSPDFLFPNTTELMVDPNDYLLYARHNSSSLTQMFSQLSDVFTSFISPFAQQICYSDMFTDPQQMGEFCEAYGISRLASFVPLTFQETKEQLRKLNEGHLNRVYDKGVGSMIIANLKPLLGWDIQDQLSKYLIAYRTGYLTHNIFMETFQNLMSFLDDDNGFLDIVFLDMIFRTSYMQPLYDDNDNMFGYVIGPRVTPLLEHDTDKRARLPIYQRLQVPYLRWYASTEYLLSSYSIRDLNLRMETVKKVIHQYSTKLELAKGNIQRIEYTNPYSWT